MTGVLSGSGVTVGWRTNQSKKRTSVAARSTYVKKVASQTPSRVEARLLENIGAPLNAPSIAVYSVALPVDRSGAVSYKLN